MLDFRIDTFLMVCKYMNFTKASEALHITQPAVSHHIRYLEEQYGAKLFVYHGKKMSLTPAGKAILNAATTIKHDDIFLRDQLAQIANEKNKLVFGATLTIGEYILPLPLSRYLMQHPETSVQMVVADTQVLLEKINRGEIDFALVEGFFSKHEYDSLLYAKESYVAVCGTNYVFSKRVAQFEDLLGERLLLREPGSGTRSVLERYLEGKNLSLDDFPHRVEISNINALKALARQNCGISFFYASAVKKELEEGTLQSIPLKDFHLTHDFTFLWRKNSIFTDRYRALFALLSQ